MMFGIGPATRIYLAAGSTDMRKSFDGLFGLVRDRLSCDPLSVQSAETAVLGWQRALGMREAPEKGRFRWSEAVSSLIRRGPTSLHVNRPHRMFIFCLGRHFKSSGYFPVSFKERLTHRYGPFDDRNRPVKRKQAMQSATCQGIAGRNSSRR